MLACALSFLEDLFHHHLVNFGSKRHVEEGVNLRSFLQHEHEVDHRLRVADEASADTVPQLRGQALLHTGALELKAALEALFTLAQQRCEVHQGGALQVLHLAGDRREQGGERAVQGVEDLLARLDQLGQGPHHLQGNPLTSVPQSKLLLRGAPES